MTVETWAVLLRVVVVVGVSAASAAVALAQTRAAPSPIPAVPVPQEVHARGGPLKSPKSALVVNQNDPNNKWPYSSLERMRLISAVVPELLDKLGALTAWIVTQPCTPVAADWPSWTKSA